MGLFRSLFKGTKFLLKTSIYTGSIYTFFAYFYVQEVKYRLKDTKETKKIRQHYLRTEFKSDIQDKDTNQLMLQLALMLSNIYFFYSRAWNFREFEQQCLKFHKNVIKSTLKNYEEYGIFKNEDQMKRNLIKNEINGEILKKISQVREVNAQRTAGSGKQYIQIVEKQVSMGTGALIGLTEEEHRKIDLIYNYIQKGLYLTTKNQEQYWKYKWAQHEIRQHRYNDAIFRLLYI